MRVAFISVLVVIAAGAGIWFVSKDTPTGFLPEEDQGAFFVAVQLPDGASVERSRVVAQRISDMIGAMPQVQGVLSIVGFSLLDGGNEPNAAFIVVRLKPFADREAAADSAQAVIGQVFGAVQQVRSANAFPFNLPPIIGLSTSGGFEYQLENLEGHDPGRHGQRDAGSDRRGEPGSSAGAGVLDLHRVQPVDLAGYRSREGAGAGSEHGRRVPDVAVGARWFLRQRLQPVRPHLGGEHPGQRAGSQRCFRHLQDLCAQPPGRDGAAAFDCRYPHRARTADHQPVQQLSRGDDQWRPAARRVVRARR